MVFETDPYSDHFHDSGFYFLYVLWHDEIGDHDSDIARLLGLRCADGGL